MKKQLLTIILIAFGGIIYAQNDIKLGGFLAYGSEIENLGIGVNAEFGIIENLSVVPSFIYYLPKNENSVKLNWWELNGDVHYTVLPTESVNLYALAGLNYTHVSVEIDGFDFGSEGSDGNIGLNLGAGVDFNLDGNILPFAELKYVIMDPGQLVVSGGVKFLL
ncbi:outer membrane protein [Aequorivita echinoideorum]|uniref:Outer membrane beta-barrel protein n=1 Tax=Aequorivita echinoideorum TaxID=1549647 RepID=A0ABS5S2N8_9FLAO|nr:outer membrane beta-barrel protein [Aequorivita echinoideorum]MBT0606704.1 outer membrane beta-barrel protein [Aequorivita echinoideorum]